MKIIRILYYLPILFTILFYGCKKEDQTRLQAEWTAKDPIAIPLNVRANERKLGNLVNNPSFETGKIYYEESSVKSYDLTGWKKVGKNIKWVNANSEEFNSAEVNTGNHAIKIERFNADETEEMGEGIISDFIKVIPGNYLLKVHLKLEDVCPNQARIGTKMYDAINIRLQYFDKNRLPIQGVEHNAFSNKKMDNTFKSLTLSNFWHIDQMGWGEVHGRTANYPYFDGDLPDQARYVKIFIGLKGTGKMWIDDIDFRFTRDNFTLLERMKPYFDSSFLAHDMVYPQPQHIEIKGEIPFYNKDSVTYPVIVIPDRNKEYLEIARHLQNNLIQQITTFNDSINPEINILATNEEPQVTSNQLVIFIGETGVNKNSETSFPDSVVDTKKNSYYIQQHESKNYIFIRASDVAAYYDALNTLSQLFDANKGIFYSANITDYPDFVDRAYLIHDDHDKEINLDHMTEKFSQYKLNHIYAEWFPGDNKYKAKQQNLKNFKSSLMIDIDQISNADQFLQKNGKEIDIQHFNSLLLMPTNLEENDGCRADRISFISNKNVHTNLEYNHIQLINAFDQWIKKKGSNSVNIEFMSPWNNLEVVDKGHGKAQFYYYDLNRNAPENLSVVWTGGTNCTNSIDYAEFYRMSKITGRNPVLMDNSLAENEWRFETEYEKNFYAGKIRVLSLFEPYNLNTFNSFYKESGKGKIILNIYELSELNTIRILTAADYYWNTEKYDPDRSLWIILNKLFGRQSATHLIYFNDAYFGLKEICRKIEINGLQFKNTRIAKNFESQLITYFDKLDKDLTNRTLVEELEKEKNDLLLKYRKLLSALE